MRKRTKKPKYEDPINYYTGQVSVLAIMRNISKGMKKFPKNAGETTT